MIHAEHGK